MTDSTPAILPIELPFGLLLSQCATLFNNINNNALADLGLTARLSTFLGRIAIEGAVDERDLADQLFIDAGTLHDFIETLSNLEAITRRVCNNNSAILEITASGNVLNVQAKAIVVEIEENFLRPISADEHKVLIKAITILLSSCRDRHLADNARNFE